MVRIISGATRVDKKLYRAGEILEAPKAMEERLVSFGVAEYLEPSGVACEPTEEVEDLSLDSMTMKELQSYAVSLGVDKAAANRCRSRDAILALIREIEDDSEEPDDMPDLGANDIVL